ncbi:MAG: GntR family transcriptional regulator [Anaerolineae bacterium]|jgi:GntR family transcriptional regulator|nr:GntR family transcriptional regulator [Anaerolineae bacterium]MBT4843467.1 GntR family transcriptional regulator [Anaerolineae bacterium]MBT7989606.1 GntR family transcriptional regulator [Anaerolineae bacterium]
MVLISPFQKLQADLGALIASVPAGERLPSEPKLAKQLGVSRATLREAMRTFETQGLIRRRQGAGTFVVGDAPVLESGLEVLESIQTMAKRMGLSVTVGNLSVETVLANEKQAQKLGVPLNTSLTRVSRVISTTERAAAYLVDILPTEFLAVDDLPKQFNGSVLDFMLGRGDLPTVAKIGVNASSASSSVAKALEIQRGDVLLRLSSRIYLDSDQVIDYSLGYFLPGYFDFHILGHIQR